MSLKVQILMVLLGCAAVLAPAAAAGTDTTTTTAETETTTAIAGSCSGGALSTGQMKCYGCSGFTTCEGGVENKTICEDTKACYQDGDTAVCLSVYLTECGGCTANQLTICDPFDEQTVNACVPDKAPVAYQTCDDGETCQNGACAAGTSTSSPGSGQTPSEACASETGGDLSAIKIIAYKPECISGLLCSGSDVLNTINCTQDQYFDPSAGSCQSLPVNNCEGMEDGIAPSRTNCSKGVVCQGGVQITDFDCKEGQVFDAASNTCVSDTDAHTCDVLDGCTFESDGSTGSGQGSSTGSGGSATTPPSSSGGTRPADCTADNVNQRYPDEGDCKSYWSCRKTSGSTYAYVKYQCMSTLVYNPSTTYCDLPENVPSCVQ